MMGLGFLVPAFLVGLAAIAIPVIIHLLNKERKDVVRFPSLMFLERIPYRAIRRQTIRHPLLLALRALAILLLVAAFARPFLEKKNDLAGTIPGGTERVILLDRSYSMGYGNRWSRAVAAVRNEIAQARPGDHLTLVAFDEGATLLSSAVLDSLKPGDRTTRLGPALATAREILAGSFLPRREIVLIGDLQRAAWDGRSEGRIPSNIESRIISVADSNSGNALVVRVDVDREARGGQVVGSVVAQIRNQESRRVTRRVTLEVQDRQLESQTVDLAPLATATVRFSALPVPPRSVAATVRLEPDALPADDALHFALSRDQSLPILVLSRAAAGRSIFLRRALAIGNEPPFEVTVQAPEAVNLANLDRHSVVVLNNINYPTGALGVRLAERVRAGTGLIVILGEGSDPSRWSQAGAALLPVEARGIVDRTGDRGGRLATLERSHRVFQPFAGPRSGDFSAARFLRYRTLEPRDSAQVLGWFDDGGIALVDGKAGQGRVLVWGSTMDDFWNDLVLQPVFLPFLHSMVRYTAGYIPDPLWRTVGQRITLATDTTAQDSRIIVSPGGTRDRLSSGGGVKELAQPGFYQVQTDSRETTRLVAVNVDRAESDLNAWNADELKAAITSNDTLASVASSVTVTDAEREQRQRVWWFLLAGAALLLLVEVVLANRLSRARLGAGQV
jgi:uncharacterized membrane protein